MQRTALTADGIAIYEIESTSKPGTMRHPVVNLDTGAVDCPGCEDFECRRRPLARSEGQSINIATPRYVCKHVERAIADCIERGEIRLCLPRKCQEKVSLAHDKENGMSSDDNTTKPLNRIDRVIEMMKHGELREGEDYGMIGGYKKPSLYKPGAQRLMAEFALASKIVETQATYNQDYVGFRVTVALMNKETGVLEGEGLGSCNSGEKRYAKQSANDIENTVLKLAKKRALIDAALDALGISSLFTQDLEDLAANEAHLEGPTNNNGHQLPSQSAQPAARQQGGQPARQHASGGISCPKCGGEMWDNRNNKRSAKAPDYKCKNQGCDHAIWVEQLSPDAEPDYCNKCNAEIYWQENRNGKRLPYDESGICHYDTCAANRPRQQQPRQGAQPETTQATHHAQDEHDSEEPDPAKAPLIAAIGTASQRLWGTTWKTDLMEYVHKYFHKKPGHLSVSELKSVYNAIRDAAEGPEDFTDEEVEGSQDPAGLTAALARDGE